MFQRNFVAPEQYAGREAVPVRSEGVGTVVLRGGAEGVKLEGQPDGSLKASLAGTVYSRDGAPSDNFVIEKQTGVTRYGNALRGFRHGIDKLDESGWYHQV